MKERYDLFIIDDDPIIIKKLISLLSKYQINIKTFIDPIEGLKQMTDYPPKAVFLDYNMPLMDGKEFIIKMSERYLFQHLSVYLITALELDENKRMQFHTLGFSKIIQKPFIEAELFEALVDSGVISILDKKISA